MKKRLLLLVSLCVLAWPAFAGVNFYRAADGKLVLEATDCQSVVRFMNLTTLPDDPPGGDTPDDPPGTNTDDSASSGEENTVTDTNPVQAGIQTILQAVLSKDEEAPQRPDVAKTLSSTTATDITLGNFNEHQEELLTYVRDVNWKTGLQLTWRDMGFFRRLRMLCTGVNLLTKPVRVDLESYAGSLDTSIENASDAAVEALANASLNHSFSSMAKLSLVGLVDALDKENPFLLLAFDEETYSKLVERNPNVQTLFEDMYTFFKIRSVLLGTDYNTSIKDLVRISKIGKGNYFKTWRVLAEYAKKMLELERQGKLSPQEEKEVQIWRLNSAMEYVKEVGRVEQRAAEILAKDPQNAAFVQQTQQKEKKKPSLNDKARKLIQNSTQDEIKQLLIKYIAK